LLIFNYEAKIEIAFTTALETSNLGLLQEYYLRVKENLLGTLYRNGILKKRSLLFDLLKLFENAENIALIRCTQVKVHAARASDTLDLMRSITFLRAP